MRDGRIVNVRMRILLDGGAYASSSTAVTANAASFACGPYNVPNALIESTSVYTNNPPCGAMRGFGAVQTCFAAEAQMDKLAAALGIDPVELRLLNAIAPGRPAADGPADHRLAAGHEGDQALPRAAGAGARGAAARGDPAARRRGQHDARRRRPARRRLRGRLQEPLLLGGLRRLLRRARAARSPTGRRRCTAPRPRSARACRTSSFRSRARSSGPTACASLPGSTADRRLVRLRFRLAHDVDGRGRGARRLPRRARGTRANRRRGRRRTDLPPSADEGARSRDRPGHGRPGARRVRVRGDEGRRRGGRRPRPDARRLDRHGAGRRQGAQPAGGRRARSKAARRRGSAWR